MSGLNHFAPMIVKFVFSISEHIKCAWNETFVFFMKIMEIRSSNLQGTYIIEGHIN